MHDARFDKLAKLLVEYSIRLKRNETVLIEAFDIPDEMTIALIRAARKAGGVPFAQTYHARVNRALALEASDRQLRLIASHELARMKKMNAYIAVRGSNNITELSDVPAGDNEINRQENAARTGSASQKDQMGGLALAHSVHGTACRNEHGGV
jgi:aminopeptidase